MLYELLIGRFTQFQLSAIGMTVAFIVTFLTLNMRFSFLPQDQGRAFAVNGALSKGKLRGVGLVFVIDFILMAVFVPCMWYNPNVGYSVHGLSVYVAKYSQNYVTIQNW